MSPGQSKQVAHNLSDGENVLWMKDNVPVQHNMASTALCNTGW